MTGKLLIFMCLLFFFAASCSRQTLPVRNYYDYDFTLPLEETRSLVEEAEMGQTWRISYRSVHEAVTSGLLTLPANDSLSAPAVIFLHGVGDSKNVDYIRTGTKYLVDAGYAVLRIDIANHGERKIHDYNFDLADGLKYWTRDVMTQTVFDLRRGIDFLLSCPEIDGDRIGFFGISLGGIIGTVFCGVDERVKVPVIALAGGGLNLMFGAKALNRETAIYLSIIDPVNFVDNIAPRPLLMLNASNDEIVPPVTTKLLYKKAGKPKKIVWYPTKHREIPLDQAFPEAVAWFDEKL